jgi:hypothetical protein
LAYRRIADGTAASEKGFTDRNGREWAGETEPTLPGTSASPQPTHNRQFWLAMNKIAQ